MVSPGRSTSPSSRAAAKRRLVVRRGPLRRRLGMAWYAGRRYLLWAFGNYRFAQARETGASLPYVHASHAVWRVIQNNRLLN